MVNLLQNSQYSWNIFFFRKSIAVEHKTLTKSIRRNIKSNKFTFGTQWLPDLLCKHWFTSSVWNFCRWGADVPPYAVFQNKQWYSVAPDDTYTLTPFRNNVFTSTMIFREISYLQLYYYMRNFCSLMGLEQWYFSLIWETYMWKLQPFASSSINK